MTRTSGDLFEVQDMSAFTSVVNTLIDHVGDGQQTILAERIGLTQSALSRLSRGLTPRITRTTAVALETATKLVSTELTDQFRAAIISPEAMRLHNDGYLAWCDERFDRWEERDGPSWLVHADGQPRSTGVADPMGLCATRRRLVQALWQIAHQDFPAVFAAFRDAMMARHVDKIRQEVAVLRVIEPLLEASQSGYVERSWSELSAKERRDFIDAGIRRELILLDRQPALARAIRIATEGAGTFARERAESARPPA
jgi:hypothetical protein